MIHADNIKVRGRNLPFADPHMERFAGRWFETKFMRELDKRRSAALMQPPENPEAPWANKAKREVGGTFVWWMYARQGNDQSPHERLKAELSVDGKVPSKEVVSEQRLAPSADQCRPVPSFIMSHRSS